MRSAPRRANKFRCIRERDSFGLPWPLLSLVLALVIFVIYMTFVPGLPTEPGLTLQHWRNIASNDRLMGEVIPNTLIVGFGTILIAFFCFAALLAS